MERGQVWTENLRGTERFEQMLGPAGAAAPFFEGGVGPEDALVRLNDGDPFAQNLQNVFRLQQRAGTLPKTGFLSPDIDAVEMLRIEKRQAFAQAVHAHDIPGGIAGFHGTVAACDISFEYQNSHSIGQKLISSFQGS